MMAVSTGATTTAWVGYACWSTPTLFSVVKDSSPVPAPMASAYSSESSEVHERVTAAVAAPREPGSMGTEAS